jgi:hypothetical protein
MFWNEQGYFDFTAHGHTRAFAFILVQIQLKSEDLSKCKSDVFQMYDRLTYELAQDSRFLNPGWMQVADKWVVSPDLEIIIHYPPLPQLQTVRVCHIVERLRN